MLLVNFHTFRSGATPSLTHSHMLIPRTEIAAVSVSAQTSAHTAAWWDTSASGKNSGLQFSRVGSL